MPQFTFVAADEVTHSKVNVENSYDETLQLDRLQEIWHEEEISLLTFKNTVNFA